MTDHDLGGSAPGSVDGFPQRTDREPIAHNPREDKNLDMRMDCESPEHDPLRETIRRQLFPHTIIVHPTTKERAETVRKGEYIPIGRQTSDEDDC